MLLVLNNYWVNFSKKFNIEIEQLKTNFLNISVCIFVLVYIASTVGRNIAYYRNQQDNRLKDLGFEIIPELSENWKIISEIIIIINNVIGIGIVFCPLFYQPMGNNYSSILIGKRVLNILSVGHVIRILMYLSTSLPSPATHCLPGSDNYNPPDTLLEIFTRFSTANDLNCGDLIFSGHIFQNTSFTILTFLYSYKLFSNKIAKILTISQVLNSISQFIFIIAARNHYTIDLVVGVYVSITLWYINLVNYPIFDEECIIKETVNEIELNDIV